MIMADACMGLVLVHFSSRKGGDDEKMMSERDTQESDADFSKVRNVRLKR